FGNFVGFEVGFLKWLMQCIAWAVMVVAFSDILANAFHFENNNLARELVQISLIVSLTIMNLLGVNFTKQINNISTICKIIPLII
ncbi:amino acid permease, partial [Escherichia coli]|nr:amino acid permease [Escherichia coli]